MKIPKGLGFLIGGQAFGASSILFIQCSTLPPARLAALRLLVAAAVLGGWKFATRSRAPVGQRLAAYRAAILPGLLLGAHFIAWNWGGRQTPAATATLVVNLVPVFMPLFAALLARELPRGREVAGSLLTVGGLVLLWGPEAWASRPDAMGLVLCFVAVLLSTAYLALGRRNRGFDLTDYLLGVYFVGGVGCFLADLATGASWSANWTTGDVVAVLGLGLVCTLGGHTMNNAALKHHRASVVAAFTVTQFLWSGILAYLLWGKMPGPMVGWALVPVLGGCLLSLTARLRVPEPSTAR